MLQHRCTIVLLALLDWEFPCFETDHHALHKSRDQSGAQYMVLQRRGFGWERGR